MSQPFHQTIQCEFFFAGIIGTDSVPRSELRFETSLQIINFQDLRSKLHQLKGDEIHKFRGQVILMCGSIRSNQE